MRHSRYDLTGEDMNELRKRVALLIHVNGLWTNAVDIVLLAMHQMSTEKWMSANPRIGKESTRTLKPGKPNLSSLFE